MDVSLTYNGKPVYYVENQSTLLDVVADIAACPEIALDTEFDKNRNSYGFNVCVIQIGLPHCIYIIDPIKLGPKENYPTLLKSLFEIIAAPHIVKIIHACSEDIRLFAKYGCTAQNIFDTKIAAKVLGFGNADSYKGVVKDLLGVELDKSQQSINWLRRPLKSLDMSYLAGDVFYLSTLKEKMIPEMERMQRTSWFEEETLITLNFDKTMDYDYDMGNIKQKLEYRNLSDYNKALFESLWKFRGEYAKELNVPPFYIYTDENIYSFLEIEHWDMNTPLPGIFKRLITTDKKRWIDYINSVKTTLTNNNISKNPPERKYMTAEEKDINARKFYKALKDFAPLQDYLTKHYGDTISKILLSKTGINKIAVAGSVDHLPRYVISEIIKAAEETGCISNIKAYLH